MFFWMFEMMMMTTFKLRWRNWRWLWDLYVCWISQSIIKIPLIWNGCSRRRFVPNLFACLYAKKYSNIKRFDKVIAKNNKNDAVVFLTEKKFETWNLWQTDGGCLLFAVGYWPSYNVPFYPVIYNMSGYPEMVDSFGPLLSYELSPRAKIFRAQLLTWSHCRR